MSYKLTLNPLVSQWGDQFRKFKIWRCRDNATSSFGFPYNARLAKCTTSREACALCLDYVQRSNFHLTLLSKVNTSHCALVSFSIFFFILVPSNKDDLEFAINLDTSTWNKFLNNSKLWKANPVQITRPGEGFFTCSQVLFPFAKGGCHTLEPPASFFLFCSSPSIQTLKKYKCLEGKHTQVWTDMELHFRNTRAEPISWALW